MVEAVEGVVEGFEFIAFGDFVAEADGGVGRDIEFTQIFGKAARGPFGVARIFFGIEQIQKFRGEDGFVTCFLEVTTDPGQGPEIGSGGVFGGGFQRDHRFAGQPGP